MNKHEKFVEELKNSFELKSFTVASSHPPTEDVTWLEYITNYIEDTMCGE